VTWTAGDQTGQFACAQIGKRCVSEIRRDGNTWPCTTDVGGSTYMAGAFCTPRSSAWDTFVTWTMGDNTGDVACAGVNKVCSDAFRRDGLNFTCQTDVGGTVYAMGARCRAVTTADGWDQSVGWTQASNRGDSVCTGLGKTCTKVIRRDGFSGPCNVDVSGATYTAYALCNTLNGTEGWTTPTTWSGLSATGSARCGLLSKTCVTAYNTDNGVTLDCGTAATNGAARCR
jgi:hypothetical protein